MEKFKAVYQSELQIKSVKCSESVDLSNFSWQNNFPIYNSGSVQGIEVRIVHNDWHTDP